MCEFGEGGEKSLDSRFWHFAKLTGEDDWVRLSEENRGTIPLPPRVQIEAASTTCLLTLHEQMSKGKYHDDGRVYVYMYKYIKGDIFYELLFDVVYFLTV